jgi:hypothetical protein
MPGGDEIRDVQRAAWAGLAAGWEKWDPVIMAQLSPVGAAMIERLGIAGDQQHLDIAAGTGEPGLTVAGLTPGGHVVLTDLSAEMEFARVLRPGGRLCSSVWVKPEENPWTTIVMQAIAAEAVLPPADPDRPGMFRCAAPGYVSVLYEAAGLREVAEWDVGVELVTRSPAQYWKMISEHVSLAVAALAQVSEPARSGSRQPSSPGPAPANTTAR